MKPYLEHIVSPPDSSWVLFDRRLQQIPFEWHYNREYELTLTLNSRGQRFIGDNIGLYDHGDLVLIGPKIPHTWCSTADVYPGELHQAIVLWFTEQFVRGMIEPHVELRSIQRLLRDSARALTFSEATRRAAQTQICAMLNQAPPARLVSLLNILLLLAADAGATPLTSTVNESEALQGAAEEPIGRVMSYLHEHYRDEISMSGLIKTAALSRSSLHRLFKQQTNMTVGAYVAQLRIGNACALLMNTRKPVAVIAADVGYANLANFNRQFRALKGQTPREFRAAFQG